MSSGFMEVVSAYLHIIGVAVYLGGSIIMEFVVGPAQKAIPPAQAQVMGKKTADRFLVFAWSALGLILFSGILRIFALQQDDFLFGTLLWETPRGRTLMAMVILWWLHVPFLILAPLFLIGTNWVYGLRRWTTLLLLPGVITLLIFLVFKLMLKVAL